MGFKSFFSRKKKETLDNGLEKTKEGVWSKISHAIAGKSKVDDDVLDNLEEAFITSDVGTDTTIKIIERLQERVARDKYVGSEELRRLLVEEISDMLEKPENETELEDFQIKKTGEPYVIMVVGVNGVGKTTTIGKLAYQYKAAGNRVVLGAADTFRAAAIEQLDIWGERVGVPVIKQKMGSDPAAVAFDTLSSAKAQGADVVIIDTAGRLHNKIGLMNELTKIKNVMKRVVPDSAGNPSGAGRFYRTERIRTGPSVRSRHGSKQSCNHQTRRHLKGRSRDRNKRSVQDTSKIYRSWRGKRRSADLPLG